MRNLSRGRGRGRAGEARGIFTAAPALLDSDGMRKNFPGCTLIFAFVAACAEGEMGGSGSVPLPTTVGITSAASGVTSVSSVSDSNGESTTSGGEAPTTGGPVITNPPSGEPGTSEPAGVCGDGNVDPDEECDGESLVGSTCQTEGFGAGKLVCNDECKLHTAGCYTCGD